MVELALKLSILLRAQLMVPISRALFGRTRIRITTSLRRIMVARCQHFSPVSTPSRRYYPGNVAFRSLQGNQHFQDIDTCGEIGSILSSVSC